MIEVIKKDNINKMNGKKYIDIETYGDYYYVAVFDGKEINAVAETWEMAMLLGISYKFEGYNSQFPNYAARMLKINSHWAK